TEGVPFFFEKVKLFLARDGKIRQPRGINPTPAFNPNSMKTKRNRFVSYLRFTASSAFFAAAAAFALVAATTNVLTTPNVATTKKGVSIKSLAKDSVSNPAKEISSKAGSVETPATAAL